MKIEQRDIKNVHLMDLMSSLVFLTKRLRSIIYQQTLMMKLNLVFLLRTCFIIKKFRILFLQVLIELFNDEFGLNSYDFGK
jgi:hypothetical protein